MTLDVTIRLCGPEECVSVLELWQQADATPSATGNLSELRRVVSENGDLFLVAESDSCIVGMIIGGWDG